MSQRVMMGRCFLAYVLTAGCTVVTDLDSLSHPAKDGGVAADGSGDASSEGSGPSCVGALFCADFDKVSAPRV